MAMDCLEYNCITLRVLLDTCLSENNTYIPLWYYGITLLENEVVLYLYCCYYLHKLIFLWAFLLMFEDSKFDSLLSCT